MILYGGAFNPPTLAHEAIIKDIIKRFKDHEVVIMPSNDFYSKDELAPFSDRVNMLKEVIANIDGNVSISLYEGKSHGYKGSYHTLEVFSHPLFVIGSDSLFKLKKWINGEKLIEENRFIVFPREGYDINEAFKSDQLLKKNIDNFIILDNFEKVVVSSTEYRKTKNEKILRKEVIDYINKHGLYKEDVCTHMDL